MTDADQTKMAKLRYLCVLFLLGVIHGATPALAEERLALLVGNQGYGPLVGPLKNPFNDVARISTALSAIGFQVTVVKDANRIALLKAIDKYAARIGDAGPNAVSFFYYSGHGIARPSNHVNYLIPVDVKDMSDDSVWYQTVSLDTILEALTQTAPDASHFVVFDACRSELHVAADAKGEAAKSFAPMSGRSGQFIAFSTSPNQTASDKGDTGGPYAIALAAELTAKGQDHLAVFQNVREKVYEMTRLSKPQKPIEVGSLLQRVFFSGVGPPTQVTTPTRTPADVDQCVAVLDTTGMSAVEAVARYKKCLNPS